MDVSAHMMLYFMKRLHVYNHGEFSLIRGNTITYLLFSKRDGWISKMWTGFPQHGIGTAVSFNRFNELNLNEGKHDLSCVLCSCRPDETTNGLTCPSGGLQLLAKYTDGFLDNVYFKVNVVCRHKTSCFNQRNSICFKERLEENFHG